MKERETPLPYEKIIPDAKQRKSEIAENPSPIQLLLDHPELPRNIAAISRLAEAARIEKIYIFGGSSASENKKKCERVSRNAMEKVPIEYVSTFEKVKQLSTGRHVVALEYTNHSIPYTEYQEKKPCLLLIGNERSGVSEELLKITNQSVHIPMLGMNSSMNVSVATGIVVYHLLNAMGRV